MLTSRDKLCTETFELELKSTPGSFDSLDFRPAMRRSLKASIDKLNIGEIEVATMDRATVHTSTFLRLLQLTLRFRPDRVFLLSKIVIRLNLVPKLEQSVNNILKRKIVLGDKVFATSLIHWMMAVDMGVSNNAITALSDLLRCNNERAMKYAVMVISELNDKATVGKVQTIGWKENGRICVATSKKGAIASLRRSAIAFTRAMKSEKTPSQRTVDIEGEMTADQIDYETIFNKKVGRRSRRDSLLYKLP